MAGIVEDLSIDDSNREKVRKSYAGQKGFALFFTFLTDAVNTAVFIQCRFAKTKLERAMILHHGSQVPAPLRFQASSTDGYFTSPKEITTTTNVFNSKTVRSFRLSFTRYFIATQLCIRYCDPSVQNGKTYDEPKKVSRSRIKLCGKRGRYSVRFVMTSSGFERGHIDHRNLRCIDLRLSRFINNGKNVGISPSNSYFIRFQPNQ